MNKTQEHLITIMIADDHLLFMEGLCGLLLSQADFSVIAKTTNGKDTLHALSKQQPDLLILDLNMPGMDGETIAVKVQDQYPCIKILVLSMYSSPVLQRKLKKIGVHGYLPKDTNTQLLFDTIRQICNGKPCFGSVSNNNEENIFLSSDVFLMKYKLTSRELEILRLIGQNFTSQQIAEKLFISMFTVDTHRKNMIYKLKVDKKNGLFQFAMSHNLS
ncbi:response regulator transcription factor [Sphingobacterium spiritivorum]|uniref:response regulator transcription factor n=1 Tax=Sphingobacterium spiritivorum TaxID=258 RepID=UPI003DA2595F